MSRAVNLFSSLLLLASLGGVMAVGQSSQSYLNDIGSTPYGVTIPVENGYINISNGNLHLEFPLASQPQRGALSLNEKLVYDSRIWRFGSFGTRGSYHWWPDNVSGNATLAASQAAGWRFVTGNETGKVSYQIQSSNTQVCDDGLQNSTTEVNQVLWTDPGGTTHPFSALKYVSSDPCTGTYTQNINGGPAGDGSGYSVSDDGSGDPLVVDSSGTQVYPQIIDRYGNYWSADASGNLSSGTTVSTTYTVNIGNTITNISSSLASLANDNGVIVSNVQTAAFGPISFQYGNGLNSALSYDTTGRLSNLWLCKGSTQASCSGGTQVYAFGATLKGAQVQATDDSVANSHAIYGYDEFNRLQTASYTTKGLSLSYLYDRYGNRWQQNVTQGSAVSPQFSFNPANNQLSGYTYDAAGNLRSDGTHSYTYDAEGNLVKVDDCATAGYVYDAFNHRVQAVANGVNNLYEYNLANQRASIWDGGSSGPQLVGATTYWNGRPVSDFDGYTVTFHHQDGLGTERLRTGVDGSVLGAYQALPFGDQANSSGSDNDAYHYAQLDSDTESNTDHAQFRQYSPTEGRWMSPDPYTGSMDLGNPQSLNRYNYVGNNPLGLTDPSGLDGQSPVSVAGGLGGCVGAVYSEGANPIADIGCAISLFRDISSLFSHPKFHGSTTPRPNAHIWDEHEFSYGANGGGALGLPGGGCEFGACGGGGFDFQQGTGTTATTSQQANVLLRMSLDLGMILLKKELRNLESSQGANGNVLPYTQTQDGVCSTGPFAGAMNGNPAILKCCQAHDSCYTRYNCNATSWLPMGFPGSCSSVCNATVAACIGAAK